MKNARYLPLLLFLAFAHAAPAKAQVTIGAFGVLNSSGLSGDAPDDFSYTGKTGFGFGLIGEIYLTNDVWLSVQPMSLARGTNIAFKLDDEEDPVDVLDLKLSYIAVPILAKFVTAGGKVYVTSGINVSFLSSAKLAAIEGDADEIDVKESFKNMDIAVDFGVGGQLPLGRMKIMLEARYEQGLLNISEEQLQNQALEARLRSSGLQLLVGILLPLGGGQ